MKKILPPSNPKIFRGSAILTGASLGTLTAMALCFQNCSPFQLETSSLSESPIGRSVASVPRATSRPDLVHGKSTESSPAVSAVGPAAPSFVR